jgi:hypothetical protein
MYLAKIFKFFFLLEYFVKTFACNWMVVILKLLFYK